MRIKERAAQKILTRANSEVVLANIAELPEDEVDGRSDMEIVIEEIEYRILMFEDDGTIPHEDLTFSQKVLEETDGGTSPGPITLPDFKFKYSRHDIEDALDTVSEYKRLKKLIKEYYR